jgi:hypothetical protein
MGSHDDLLSDAGIRGCIYRLSTGINFASVVVTVVMVTTDTS